MNLRLSLLAVVILAVSASCNFVIAETPKTYVHLSFLEESDVVSITMSGESQLEIVSTVAESVHSMQSAEAASVLSVNSPSRPFAKPTESDQEYKCSLILYCEGQDDNLQAYIAMTPMIPFCLVSEVVKRLKDRQITRIKYLNYDDFDVDNIQGMKDSFSLSKGESAANLVPPRLKPVKENPGDDLPVPDAPPPNPFPAPAPMIGR